MGDRAATRLGPVREAPLSTAFDEIWVEWLALWRQAASAQAASDDDAQRGPASQLAEESGMLARRLARLAQARAGAAAAQQVEAAQFVFVALVDETVLFNDWPGQSAWQAAPLEMRLFGTRMAGEQIPQRIEQLLRERDPAQRDLANVYLQGLLLGFHGRLRSGQGLAQHEEWRRALFAFAWQRDPDYRRLGAMLERPAALPPVRLAARRTLPDGFRLGIILLLLLLLMLGIGHLFWLDIARHLRPAFQLAAAAAGAWT